MSCSPAEYERRVNATYGAPEFQVEMRHRTRQNKCGLESCEKMDCPLQQCSRCKIRQYCCRDHQRSDWNIHQKYCRVPINDLQGPQVEECPARYQHEMPHSERAKGAITIAERLIQFFDADLYPPANEELLYGIQMIEGSRRPEKYVGIDCTVGTLMYSAWKFLYRAYLDFHHLPYDEDSDDDRESFTRAMQHAKALFVNHVAQAILAGELPSWFKSSIRKYREKNLEENLKLDAYVEELLRREMKGIKWNNKVLEALKLWPRPGDPVSSPLNTDPSHWLT